MKAPDVTSSGVAQARRRRLSGPERRAKLLAAARELIVRQGYLPLSIEALARHAGVSKALVYAYFPGQHDLYNAVVEAELDDLEGRGLAASAAQADLGAAACDAAQAYLDHVGERGTALHIIYRDPYMAGRLVPRGLDLRDRVLGAFARRARTAYGLPVHEAVAAANLVLTVPEETGRLVFQGTLTPERGRLVCRELVLGCLAALAGRAAV